MIEYNGKTLLSTSEVCQVLDRSTDAVRQLIYRKKLPHTKIGSRLYFDTHMVHNFFPNKAGLPAFESLNGEKYKEEFYDLRFVRKTLNYTPGYLRGLVKKGALEGYCTAAGKILITKSSLDKFMGVYDESQDI